MISGQINSNTKLLMERDIRARVTKLAPFLQFDADPYPVVLGDRTVWVMDGYTTTDQYPYAQSLERRGLARRTSFNYVRNSVKVTVDAYQGTVTFYVFDKKDPIIKAYRAAFPDLFTDGSQMPAAIRAHLRYPEDLFKSQSTMFGRYHVTEPKRFYDGSAKWLVSPDPGSGPCHQRLRRRGDRAPPAARRRRQQPAAGGDVDRRSASSPYYLNIRLPGEKDEHFIILVPFVPVSSGNSQTRLVSFLTADSDPGAVRQAAARSRCRRVRPCSGPVQVNNAIIRTPAISTAITLLEPAGLADHPGQHAADPGRQLDRLRAAVLRAGPRQRQRTRSSSSSSCSPRTTGRTARRRCRTVSTSCSGASSTITTCNVARGQQSGGTGTGPATTTTTTPTTTAPGVDDDHRPAGHHHDPAGDRERRRTCSTRPRPSSTRPSPRSTTGDLGPVPALW